MQTKTTVVFWAAVAAAVFLLGGTIGSIEALRNHPSIFEALVLLTSLAGLAFAALIAGRILLVVGRAQRLERRDNS